MFRQTLDLEISLQIQTLKLSLVGPEERVEKEASVSLLVAEDE